MHNTMMSLDVSEALADTIIPMNEQENMLDKTPDPSKYNCTIETCSYMVN